METTEIVSAYEKWERLIGEWKESGLSQAEFCRRHNLDSRYFSKWKSKLGLVKVETSFMEIPLETVKSSQKAGLNIGLSVRDDGEIVISIKP